MEIAQLETAIRSFVTTYGYFPISTDAESSGHPDFTFGTIQTGCSVAVTNDSGYQANNSEILAILCVSSNRFGKSGTSNLARLRNPKQIVFIIGNFVPGTKSEGIGEDGVFRDPWGNPYIISLDLNHDGQCQDAFYKLSTVSERDSTGNGLKELIRPSQPSTNSVSGKNSFEARNVVMIWSLGPDGKADSAQKANMGVNKDNILSWVR